MYVAPPTWAHSGAGLSFLGESMEMLERLEKSREKVRVSQLGSEVECVSEQVVTKEIIISVQFSS